MKSIFVTGTDTDVGKTWIAAGLARAIKNLGIDVGVMKPFSAGTPQNTGYKSEDVQILSNAAKVNDPEELVNPLFFTIPASPYTAVKNSSTKIKVDIDLVLSCFKKLSKMHQMILVEGMGGIMTPVLKNYFITDLIKDLALDALIVTRNRIGSLNHTIMTCMMTKKFGIKVAGIIINGVDPDGYDYQILKDDVEDIIGYSVIGFMPRLRNFDIDLIANTIQKNFELKSLID